MSSMYNVQGDRVFVVPEGRTPQPKLPSAVMSLEYHDLIGFYLQIIDNFELPTKLYGDVEKKADKVINTFFDRNKSTGVLLLGSKGSGKTLLTKVISNKLITNYLLPTIIINTAFSDQGFMNFLQSIDQKCMIVFDEFEKKFNKESQESILTLLDGTMSSDKLYLLTANSRYDVDEHMINRPGRVFYLIEYKGVSVDFIREYCKDKLKNPSDENIRDIIKINSRHKEFNFDMLSALVEEMNRYDETAEQSYVMLNIKPLYTSFNENVYHFCFLLNQETGEITNPSFIYHNQMKIVNVNGNKYKPTESIMYYDTDRVNVFDNGSRNLLYLCELHDARTDTNMEIDDVVQTPELVQLFLQAHEIWENEREELIKKKGNSLSILSTKE